VSTSSLSQSVLAVLGKASSLGIVDRLDLKIIDPSARLQARRRPELNTGDEESDDERPEGRETILVLRMVCKHGQFLAE
jgi:hypothetical protein